MRVRTKTTVIAALEQDNLHLRRLLYATAMKTRGSIHITATEYAATGGGVLLLNEILEGDWDGWLISACTPVDDPGRTIQ